MDEQFLHFLWKYQKFTKLPLQLSDGSELKVLNPGFHNHNAGPDFLESKINIAGMAWAGSVEIHYQASDWFAHKHHTDEAYANVILHVVWKDDKSITHPDNTNIPTLILSDFIDPNLQQEYRAYINQPETIRCASVLQKLTRLTITSMLDHALVDRLEAKAQMVMDFHRRARNDWEQTAYWLLARNFGFSINKEAFETLATLLPYRIPGKHIDHPDQVYALIFGAAGFLNEARDSYQKNLQAEYRFLQQKYQLKDTLHRHQWKFSRLRPANFPTVRLSQFASFLIQNKRLFSFFTDWKNIRELQEGLDIKLPNYWENHYDFGKPLSSGHNHFGKSSTDNILVNTAAPLLAAYSKFLNEPALMDKAMSLLEAIKPEQNKIIRKWKDAGVEASSAFDSQGLIQQYNEFCLKKKCLSCNIGVAILDR